MIQLFLSTTEVEGEFIVLLFETGHVAEHRVDLSLKLSRRLLVCFYCAFDGFLFFFQLSQLIPQRFNLVFAFYYLCFKFVNFLQSLVILSRQLLYDYTVLLRLLLKFFQIGYLDTLLLCLDFLKKSFDLPLVVVLELFTYLLDFGSKLRLSDLRFSWLGLDLSSLCLGSPSCYFLVHRIGRSSQFLLCLGNIVFTEVVLDNRVPVVHLLVAEPRCRRNASQVVCNHHNFLFVDCGSSSVCLIALGQNWLYHVWF